MGAAVSLAAAFLICTLVFLIPSSSYVDDPADINALKKTREIMKYVDERFLGEFDRQELADYMYLGLVSGLDDPYSTYFTKSEYEDVSMKQHGEYRGIGVTVATRAEDGALQITSVTPGGPSERAGVKADDLILSIDGQDFSEKPSSDAVEYIRELDADSLELTVYREETKEELTFTIPMEALEAYSVYSSMAEEGIGYIQITSFTGKTQDQFKDAMEDLKKQGMKALIVDLRGNLGGLVVAVRGVLESFMPEGLLYYTEDKYGNRVEYSCEGTNVLDIPMAVLVNKNTASASEIFSGAVKDHKVGTLIGTVTYGKGIVQDSYVLADGSVLRITTSHYYTPNGVDIHKHGITPDIEVENPDGADLQYKKAVQVLKEEMQDI